ncbi:MULTISPECIES: serine--tRNA ligase [unclassified Pseudoclavibacter]|uniref:serine--tRNA ligase n=1 Tax=unclassified Pseudoclavibacter TaxID=2615177 RepID=UPI0013019941|nr:MULTISPECIES: serine--tRNA ligase [unclassified Pseudoclavibacter]KAB1647107.1 serine--tRNA ligase [Pseudoclavibacter sp. CFCC 14310]KAB1662915.1 serine--tRNA ligase [Pseudoclavibacter sp. CFCC 13611]
MIDVELLRTNPDLFRESQRARGGDVSAVDQALEADASRRVSLTEFETLRAQQNAFGKQVAKAPKEEKAALVAQVRELADQVKQAEGRARKAEEQFSVAVRGIQNLVLEGVPEGGEDDFTVEREIGEHPQFDFEPKDHVAIGEHLGLFDLERGAKVSGARFYYLTGWGARLELALLNLALDQAIENGFTPMITPTIVNPEIMQGTGFLDQHSDEIYHLDADDQYLTGTSEVALAGYHSDEIIDLTAGPKRYAGWSTCYRREAGSHGKDTRGILRVHQFNKLEMFVYTTPDQALAEHQRLLSWEEQMLQKVELPYRVINTAAGDLGSSAAQKFDTEAWIPTQHTYRELTSTSNCTTYQARRLGIRYRPEEGGKTAPVATLNGTLATTRWLVAILENHQQADGSVRVPAALRPYLGGIEAITPGA